MTGKLVLVDLAGMESSKKSYAVEGASAHGQRREEARHINTSLYALGTVIEKLSSSASSSAGGGGGGGRGGIAEAVHVPFRNSKLTRYLQECLVGNSATAFVVTLRAEAENLDECAATLRFAQRARAVPVRVHPNVKTAPPDPSKLKAELRAVTRELTEAKALIERLQREAVQRPPAGSESGSGRQQQQQQQPRPQQQPQRPQPMDGPVTMEPMDGPATMEWIGHAETEAEAAEARLLAGRLQIGQLAERMSELVEQTRSSSSAGPAGLEGAAAEVVADASGGPG